MPPTAINIAGQDTAHRLEDGRGAGFGGEEFERVATAAMAAESLRGGEKPAIETRFSAPAAMTAGSVAGEVMNWPPALATRPTNSTSSTLPAPISARPLARPARRAINSTVLVNSA